MYMQSKAKFVLDQLGWLKEKLEEAGVGDFTKTYEWTDTYWYAYLTTIRSKHYMISDLMMTWHVSRL
jgi:hypothetical protein